MLRNRKNNISALVTAVSVLTEGPPRKIIITNLNFALIQPPLHICRLERLKHYKGSVITAQMKLAQI